MTIPRKRDKGITEVIDMWFGLNATEDLVSLCGAYVDTVRLAGGMAVLYPRDLLKKKIKLLHQANISVCTGGTIIERFVRDHGYDRLDAEFITDYIEPLGFDIVEYATAFIRPTTEKIVKGIKKIRSRGYPVDFEIGFKNPDEDKALTVEQRVKLMRLALDAGANKLKVESREAGINVGIFDEKGKVIRPMVEECLDLMGKLGVSINDVIWEAPLKNQQAELIEIMGPEVNLGNIPFERVLLLEGYRQGVKFETMHLVKDGDMLDHGSDKRIK
jgi:phosphosulfolactate synthase